METPDAARLVDLWTRLTPRVVAYGFTVQYGTLEPPRTGIFDGLRIVIDPAVGFETQCFLILHLFGHSVQWVAPSYVPEIRDLPADDAARFVPALRRYEYDAARFGRQLMAEAGVTGLDAWFADFVATDWRYVERFYLEGAIPPWDDCLVRGAALIEPLPIPPLEPRPVEVRYAF